MTLKRIAARLAAGSLLAGSLTLAGITGTALADTPHSSAAPTPSTNVALSAHQASAPLAPAGCFTRDGTAPSGSRRGGAPVRFEYGDSPYVGARYNSCEGSVKVHFGGYTGITHYNVTVNGKQRETRAGDALVLTVPVNPGNPVSLHVQACKRGGIITPVPGFPPIRERSSCTRNSPPVTVQTR